MFSKNDIQKLSKQAYKEFLKKHDVSCQIKLIDLDLFWKLAKKSRLIQDDIKRKIPLKVGSLVVHGKKEVIYLNQDIINGMSNDPSFVKALVIHELCHVYLRNKLLNESLGEEIRSENRAENMVESEFPKYSSYLI